MSCGYHNATHRVRARSSHLGELPEAPFEAFARAGRATNDEDGVVAADSTEHVRPGLAVERRRDGLGASGNSPHDDQLADPIDACEQLWQKRVQGRSGGAAQGAIRRCVADTLGGGDTRQPELSQVAREGGLGDVPPALVQQDSQLFLAADGLLAHQLQDGCVTFSLVQARAPP